MEKTRAGHKTFDELKAIRSCQEGRTSAFNALVIRYQDRVFNTLFRMTGDYEKAADLAQEVFIKAYEAIGSFRAGSSFYTWIYRIAINTVYSERRRSMRKSQIKQVGLPADPSEIGNPGSKEKNNPVEILKRKEVEKKLQSCISALEDGMREVVVLRDIEGMDYGMISEALALPIGTVKSRLHRARMELREKLKGFL